jgi:hypothetical protein
LRESTSDTRARVARQALFRRAADVTTTVLAGFDEVAAVVLFGSVGTPLRKAVSRFRNYHRAGIVLWHECTDVDIAVWQVMRPSVRAGMTAQVPALLTADSRTHLVSADTARNSQISAKS